MCSAGVINVFYWDVVVLKLMCSVVMLCAEINVFVVLKLMCPAVRLCAEINVFCWNLLKDYML